jgi:hypothetical protein
MRIGEDAFLNTSIYNDESNWEDEVLYISNYLIEARETIPATYVVKPNTKLIADCAFDAILGESSLTSISIPGSVKYIGESAFSMCHSLETVTLSEGLKRIGDEAFHFCSSLKSIILPKTMTELGHSVFANCDALKSINIPDNITTIEDEAFICCESLASVTIGKNVSKIGDLAFLGCDSIKELNFNGTIKQWNDIDKGTACIYKVPAKVVHCLDGDITL